MPRPSFRTLRFRELAALGLASAVASSACRGPGEGARSAASGVSGVDARRSDEHPPIVLVERLGDPQGAVAFAFAHDGGASVSTALAALLTARLEARGVTGLDARPHSLGFAVSAAAPSAAQAGAFVTRVRAALGEPVRPNEPGLARARAAVEALASRRFPGRATAAAANCSGELGSYTPAGLALDAASGAEKLNAWLASALSIEAASFGAVGPKAVLEAVERAVLDAQAWPKGTAPDDPWPATGEIAAEFSAALPRRLTLAVRLPSAGVALESVEALADPREPLTRRLTALAPDWHLERAVAVTRPRGACLRVDVVPESGDAGPDAAQVARALTVLSEEVERALSAHQGAAATTAARLDDALLRPTHPGEAAAAAAWRGLVNRLPGERAQRFFAYQGPVIDRRGFELGRAQARLREAYQKSNLELRSRLEQGQAGFWMLLATRCGTGLEGTNDAGEAAFLATTLARKGPDDGVEFEPWIAADGVGLLAHAVRKTPNESASAQGLRVARALGDRLATLRPTPGEQLRARDELMQALGGSRRPGLAYLLSELSGEHPSWLEPRGTIESLSQAASRGYEGALHRFLATPLRVAVLANGDAAQAELARRELDRWLIPVRGEPVRCPAPPPKDPAGPLELTISTSPGALSEGAYLALPLPRFEGRLPIEARATLFLLNRNGGSLDRALADLPASASAIGLGGPRSAALVIQLAAPEEKRAEARARLKAIVAGLANRPPSAAELGLAARELAAEDAQALQDPRRRIVDLWRADGAAENLDPQKLARFQATVAAAPPLVLAVEANE